MLDGMMPDQYRSGSHRDTLWLSCRSLGGSVAGCEGGTMISPASNFRIYLASEPVDFRKGMGGLAACVANSFKLNPYSGAIYMFRSRRAGRLKILDWDGSGLVLIMKRLNGKRFTWPKVQAARCQRCCRAHRRQ
ncbi:IS66 family insertion sequence element accessory protein TnpB (plasmid) [Leisingera sp. M527]|uniref:IS66 family insertion sequence element accessory protein TnpB n=1 Tax=Leisingera sp. M527 TaxID=2867014 RepID=UPI0021A474A6|nr:IS66 family insertion sequence element accessory protein TnpB [Leisingera sp. M527]UWQ35676.1 IS66 family insertion sequence element accessory protein TnpB [Leisingera sp. M527]